MQNGSSITNAISFYGGEIFGEKSTLQLGGIYIFPAAMLAIVTPEGLVPASFATRETEAPKEIETPVPTIATPEATKEVTAPLTPQPKPTEEATPLAPVTTAPAPKKSPEIAPEIKIWFDNRIYQAALVERGDAFIVSKRPKIKIEVKIAAPYALSSEISNYSISIDKTLVKANALSSAQNLRPEYRELILDCLVPNDLTEGVHVFEFSAKSSGGIGIPTSITQKASVVVKGGGLSIIGEVLPFPSPFSPSKNTGVEIQYTLSENTDIEIYLFSISGETVKRISCFSGSEGGQAGLNKVKWDGKLDAGGIAGNGIYLGTIISKKDSRLLKKFKVNIFD